MIMYQVPHSPFLPQPLRTPWLLIAANLGGAIVGAAIHVVVYRWLVDSSLLVSMMLAYGGFVVCVITAHLLILRRISPLQLYLRSLLGLVLGMLCTIGLLMAIDSRQPVAGVLSDSVPLVMVAVATGGLLRRRYHAIMGVHCINIEFREAYFPHLWRAGRIRTHPDSRADPGGSPGGARPWAHRREAKSALARSAGPGSETL